MDVSSFLTAFVVVARLFVSSSYSCSERVFKLMPFKDYKVNGDMMTISDLSLNECGQKCGDTENCYSFGYTTTSNQCILYAHRAWPGEAGVAVPGLVTYWRLADACPSGYTYNATYNACFNAPKSYVTRSWDLAMQLCKVDGGYLFISNSEEKSQMVVDAFGHLSPTDKTVFVGATGVSAAGTWTWLDGSAINTWGTGEPNNINGNEDCVVLDLDRPASSNILAVQCNAYRMFLCEIPMRSN